MQLLGMHSRGVKGMRKLEVQACECMKYIRQLQEKISSAGGYRGDCQQNSISFISRTNALRKGSDKNDP